MVIAMPANALTLFAIWEDIPTVTYSVTYDLNGGTGTAPTETAKAENAAFIAAASAGLTAPTADKRFKEWNTLADGMGTGYAAGDEVTMPANALTLYAIWEIATYSVTYNLNGGTGTAPTQAVMAEGGTFAAAGSAGLTAPTDKRFKEWNTLADGMGTSYAAGATVTMPATTTPAPTCVPAAARLWQAAHTTTKTART